MARDDAYVERYSRQLILAEIGPHGQERLGAARVAVAARGAAADRVVAYLAAAGVGTLAVAAAQCGLVDPEQPGVCVETLRPEAAAFDAALVDADTASDAVAARHRFWIAGGRAAETPPCPDCAAAVLGAARAVADPLATLQDAVLGTVVATEIVKAIVGVGAPLTSRVLTYEPATATLTTTVVAPRPDCRRCAGA